MQFTARCFAASGCSVFAVHKVKGNIRKRITYKITIELAVLSEYERGFTKEINLVSWNRSTSKYDIMKLPVEGLTAGESGSYIHGQAKDATYTMSLTFDPYDTY